MASTAAEDINMAEEIKTTEASSSRMPAPSSQGIDRHRHEVEVDDPLKSASASRSGSELADDQDHDPYRDDELNPDAPMRLDSDEEMDVQAVEVPVKREHGQDKPRTRGAQHPAATGRKGHGRLLHSDITDKFRHEIGDIFLNEDFTPLGSSTHSAKQLKWVSNGSSAQPLQAAPAPQNALAPS